MRHSSSSFRPLIVSGFLLLLGLGTLVWWESTPRGGASVRTGTLPVIGQVTDFHLTNQSGVAIGAGDLRGRIWVGDIIFTRCPGPCVRMTTTLRALQDRLAGLPDVALFSLTADPEFDSPEVLARYARRFGADTNRWQFLTGSKAEIYRLATRDLLLVVADNATNNSAPPEDLFLHSTRLVLLDAEGRLRAAFDGEDTNSVPEVLRALEALRSGR